MQYLLLIYNDPAKMQNLSPADYQTMAEGYRAWLEANEARLRGQGGWPATITTVRVEAGKTLATDGPFAEAREGVGGFVVIEAASQAEAVEIAAGIPSAAMGAVEVRPLKT